MNFHKVKFSGMMIPRFSEAVGMPAPPGCNVWEGDEDHWKMCIQKGWNPDNEQWYAFHPASPEDLQEFLRVVPSKDRVYDGRLSEWALTFNGHKIVTCYWDPAHFVETLRDWDTYKRENQSDPDWADVDTWEDYMRLIVMVDNDDLFRYLRRLAESDDPLPQGPTFVITDGILKENNL